eukprot:gb/GECH01005551.1/.p1 GENE.gb/GECH01005551.1/~~gb/GECH01005551.1/.p1  ORF type:complete len:145 (+),score=26.25 gb/GECH01005551.1/:1-435(+)
MSEPISSPSKTRVQLYQFPVDQKTGGSYSPFCLKVELFLRANNIPYETDFSLSVLQKAPKGKLPYIKYRGKITPDSSLIISELIRIHGGPDTELTAKQRALGVCVQRLVEDHLYWYLVYVRWIAPENKSKVRLRYYLNIYRTFL